MVCGVPRRPQYVLKCPVDLFIKIYWEEKGRERGGGLKELLRGENLKKKMLRNCIGEGNDERQKLDVGRKVSNRARLWLQLERTRPGADCGGGSGNVRGSGSSKTRSRS